MASGFRSKRCRRWSEVSPPPRGRQSMISVPPTSPDWQAATDDLAHCGQVGRDPRSFLHTPDSQSETGHHFVKDQDRSVVRASPCAKPSRYPSRAEMAAVGRVGFHDDGDVLFTRLSKGVCHCVRIVIGKDDGFLGETFRNTLAAVRALGEAEPPSGKLSTCPW